MLILRLQYNMAEVDNEVSQVDEEIKLKVPSDQVWKLQMGGGRLSFLINNELMSDVTFVVKEKRFVAHKFVLALASEVFHAMFYGPLADDKNEIEIVDCEKPEDFLEFLSLIYGKSAEITWDNVKQLSYLRKKYMIQRTGPFVNFISSNEDTDIILNALGTSLALEEDDMIEECLKVIRRDISVLGQTEQFLKLTQPSIKLILKQDLLNIEEIDLFKAVDKWCSYQVEQKKINQESTTKREVLGDARYYIRFSIIDLEDFAEFCSPSRILSSKETVLLYDAIVLGPSEIVAIKNQKLDEEDNRNENGSENENINLLAKFVPKPRVKSNLHVCLADYQRQNFSGAVSDSTMHMMIKCNKDVWLKGLNLYGSSISNILVNDKKYILKYSWEGLALLMTPIFMEAGSEHSVYFGSNYFVDFWLENAKAYKWHGFACRLWNATRCGRNSKGVKSNSSIGYNYLSERLIACRGLILSIFDGQSIDNEKNSFVNLIPVQPQSINEWGTMFESTLFGSVAQPINQLRY